MSKAAIFARGGGAPPSLIETPYLWNCENGALGSQPATDDQGEPLSYFASDIVNFPAQELVADPVFGSFAAQSVGGVAPLSSDFSRVHTTAISTKFDLAGVDFCIEGFFEFPAQPASSFGNDLFGTTGSNVGINILTRGQAAETQVGIGYKSGLLEEEWALVDVPLNTKTHLALAGIGDILTLYIAGVASATYDITTHGIGPLAPGASYSVWNSCSGDMATLSDSMRVTRLCGVYNANFTPPASALTALVTCPI